MSFRRIIIPPGARLLDKPGAKERLATELAGRLMALPEFRFMALPEDRRELRALIVATALVEATDDWLKLAAIG